MKLELFVCAPADEDAGGFWICLCVSGTDVVVHISTTVGGKDVVVVDTSSYCANGSAVFEFRYCSTSQYGAVATTERFDPINNGDGS